MADKLEWMNKHFAAIRYTTVSQMREKEGYKIPPGMEAWFSEDSGERMAFKLGEAGKWKDACELLAYQAHRRSGVWWGYRCVLSLMQELILNPGGERDIATIGIQMEPEVPEFARFELPKPNPAALAQAGRVLAGAKEKAKEATASLDPAMLRYVEDAVEAAFQEFKRIHGIHPVDLLKQIGAKLTQPRYEVDPESPIIVETAKLKAQLAAAQKETVEAIKSVLPPKIPAYQKKISDKALAAVYRWVAAPDPENARLCLDAGNECPDQPGGLLSLAAFWAFGNLIPSGDQVIPTPPGLAANGLVQTLLLCALAPGGVRKTAERYAEYFRLGVGVLTGGDNWADSLADRLMPHEQLPEPDWTRATDKSAAEWQAEAGIAGLAPAKKEEAIQRLIAGILPAAPLSRENKPPVPVPGGGEPPPVYHRWKPPF
jgi:hypothetical protein